MHLPPGHAPAPCKKGRLLADPLFPLALAAPKPGPLDKRRNTPTQGLAAPALVQLQATEECFLLIRYMTLRMSMLM